MIPEVFGQHPAKLHICNRINNCIMSAHKVPDSEIDKLINNHWEMMDAYYDRRTNTIVTEFNPEYLEDNWGMTDEKSENEAKANSKVLEADTDRYVPLSSPSDSRNDYQVMAAFVTQLPEDKYKYKMEAALEGRKPFRNFKDQVDNSPHRQDWFKFQYAAQLQEYREHLRWELDEEE